jgi:hypothetical protein
MAFEAPFEVRPSHFFKHHQIKLAMCDFVSAGDDWSESNLYRIWLPQPLFLEGMYPADTWKLMYPEKQVRPQIPVLDASAKKAANPSAKPVGKESSAFSGAAN